MHAYQHCLFLSLKWLVINAKSVNNLCRDRSGVWPTSVFNLRSCAGCYGYLFPLSRDWMVYHDWLVPVNNSKLQTVSPDIHNTTVTGNRLVEHSNLTIMRIIENFTHRRLCKEIYTDNVIHIIISILQTSIEVASWSFPV